MIYTAMPMQTSPNCMEGRHCVYWINVNSEIAEMIAGYPLCNQFQNREQKETLIQYTIPSRVWSKFCTDLFNILTYGNSKYYSIENHQQ